MKHFSLKIAFLLAFLLVDNAMSAHIGGDCFKLSEAVLRGDYPDPSIMRDGKDYYMVHSGFDYIPGLTVMHSRDLIHWEPIGSALNRYLGSIWAPDICKYKGRYYIYFTVAGKYKSNYVVTADSPDGKWSDPVDLKIGQIDPCHIADENGHRWMFLSGGYRVRLSDDGLSIDKKTFKHVYDGWDYPSNWITEGFCLEGPKIKHIGDYYYYISAEGGTSGAPTSHMVVVARSKSIDGPWENMPANPLVHTYTATDRWWSRGHGSLIDTPDGKWYIVYHAYENGYYNLGRQTLISPVNITADGWMTADVSDTAVIRTTTHDTYDKAKMLPLFRIGKEWKGYKGFDISRVSTGDSSITITAQGSNPAESAPLLFIAGEHAYEFSMKIQLQGDAMAGILLMYDANYFVGSSFNKSSRCRWRMGQMKNKNDNTHTTLWLRLRNDHHVVTGCYSTDGINWKNEKWGMEISGYNHNTLYYFLSVLPGLFVYGKDGKATFSELKYTVLKETRY